MNLISKKKAGNAGEHPTFRSIFGISGKLSLFSNITSVCGLVEMQCIMGASRKLLNLGVLSKNILNY